MSNENVLNDDSGAGGDVTTFRLVTLAVISTAALAVAASMFIHRFAPMETVQLPLETMVGAGWRSANRNADNRLRLDRSLSF